MFDPRIHRVLAAISARPNISLKELACLVDLSPSRLQHLFKRECRTSIKSFTLEVRLLKAASVLAESTIPIKQVCRDVGILDLSNFGRYFRKRYGISPGRYRKECRAATSTQLPLGIALPALQNIQRRANMIGLDDSNHIKKAAST